MTTQPAPNCQWCSQPAQAPVTRWDGQPQCGDPFACDARIEREKAGQSGAAGHT